MTSYVDDAGIQATVHDPSSGRRYTSRWCHLFSDHIDQMELHAFAERIGLKRAWSSPGTPRTARCRVVAGSVRKG